MRNEECPFHSSPERSSSLFIVHCSLFFFAGFALLQEE